MKELIDFIHKDKQKEYLEIFMILDQISRKNDILSFTYNIDYLIVQIGLNDYIKILMKEVKEC